MMHPRRALREQKGAVLVEYSVLVAGIALVALAAVAILGHKTTDLISSVAAILPGAHADDNNPLRSGKFIETAVQDGAIAVDSAAIVAASDTSRLAVNLGIAPDDLTALVVEVEP